MTKYVETSRAAAAFLGLSKTRLDYAIRTNQGPKYTRTKFGALRFTETDLRRWKRESLGMATAEAAAYLSLAPGYLARLRRIGGGPKFSRRGNRIRYAREDLDAWQAPRKRRAAENAARLLERADAMFAAANRLKQLSERTARVPTEAFE